MSKIEDHSKPTALMVEKSAEVKRNRQRGLAISRLWYAKHPEART